MATPSLTLLVLIFVLPRMLPAMAPCNVLQMKDSLWPMTLCPLKSARLPTAAKSPQPVTTRPPRHWSQSLLSLSPPPPRSPSQARTSKGSQVSHPPHNIMVCRLIQSLSILILKQSPLSIRASLSHQLLVDLEFTSRAILVLSNIGLLNQLLLLWQIHWSSQQ